MTPQDLARRREALGHSQNELAARLGYAKATINRWEAGERIENPTVLDLALQTLERRAQQRGCSTTQQRDSLSRAGRRRDPWEPADDDWLRAHPQATHAQAAARLSRTLYAVRERRRVLAGLRDGRRADAPEATTPATCPPEAQA